MQLSKIAYSAFGLSLASNFALADFTNFPSSNCAVYSGTSTLCNRFQQHP